MLSLCCDPAVAAHHREPAARVHEATWVELVARYGSTPHRLAQRTAQKRKYGGELFPADWPADAHGTSLLLFFQRDRASGRPKGIIAIDLGDLP
jgi:hypothetical protein